MELHGVEVAARLLARNVSMTFPLRIGTRRSRLALAQSGMMQRAIARALGVPGDEVETAVPLVEITTRAGRAAAIASAMLFAYRRRTASDFWGRCTKIPSAPT